MPGSIIVMIIKAVIVVTTCVSLCSCHFRNGKLDIVQYIVTKTNCDMDAKNVYGDTPLDLARR